MVLTDKKTNWNEFLKTIDFVEKFLNQKGMQGIYFKDKYHVKKTNEGILITKINENR